MKINVLQSLIDRTSNQIAEYEACVAHEKAELVSWCPVGWERAQHKYCLQYYNSKLPKLREIQKALKKEIAGAFLWERTKKDIFKGGLLSELKSDADNP